MLKLPDALRLAWMLSPYMPVAHPQMTIIEFANKILDAIVIDNKHRVYLQAVALMTGSSVEELLELAPITVFQQFVEGLLENHILTLIEFYRGL